MWKQNQIYPKYILITPNQSNKNINSVKSLSTHNKRKRISFKNTMFALNRQNQKCESVKGLQTIEKFKSFTNSVQKQMKNIHTQLSDCMSSISSQTNKNQILQNIISILQQDLKQVQEGQKQIKQTQNQQHLKKINKIQYDIQQILQRYNEEVAKIITLKEQAASARSDRVVFSNLFKNIEKQIKQNEQFYTQQIIKTELNYAKKVDLQNNTTLQEPFSIQQSISELVQDIKEQKNYFANRKIFINKISNSRNNLFITHLQQKYLKLNKKNSNRRAITNFNNTNQLQFLIEQMQGKVDKIIKTTQCQTFQQTKKYYQSIDKQNEKLLDLIAKEETKIELVEKSINMLRNKKVTAACQEDFERLSDQIKIKSNKTFTTQESQNEDQNIQIFSKILTELGIPHQKTNLTDSILSKAQSEIEKIFNFRRFEKFHSNLSNHSIVGRQLDNVLNKMQKFDSCDRIMNKKQFYSEYIKELGKSKRLLKFKK